METGKTLSSDEIKKILPHRYPFLLIDKVVDYEPGSSAKAIKCVSSNELFFQGHFPEKQVMPGVLILEALAQTGAIAILTEEGMNGKIVLFGGVKNARFKKQVLPGDVLELQCHIITRKGPIGIGEANAYVDGKLAVTAQLTFAIDVTS